MRQKLGKRLRAKGRSAYDRLYSRPAPKKRRLGSVDAWVVCLGPISDDAIVYSAGVGKEITFERDLISRAGCRVFLFDPSPTGILTMQQAENLDARIRFEALGLTERTTDMWFSGPLDPLEGSFFVTDAPEATDLKAHCEDLQTVMTRLGHTRIDLLKMDIEGSEYGVISHIEEASIPVIQICVEFHPWMYKDGKAMTREAMSRLRRLGFTLVHRHRHDYTFLRKDYL